MGEGEWKERQRKKGRRPKKELEKKNKEGERDEKRW